MRYRVGIILNQIEVEAESEEKAKEIAEDIYCSDAHTRLYAGLCIVGFETEVLL